MLPAVVGSVPITTMLITVGGIWITSVLAAMSTAVSVGVIVLLLIVLIVGIGVSRLLMMAVAIIVVVVVTGISGHFREWVI
jgi:hypothetical protein